LLLLLLCCVVDVERRIHSINWIDTGFGGLGINAKSTVKAMRCMAFHIRRFSGDSVTSQRFLAATLQAQPHKAKIVEDLAQRARETNGSQPHPRG
jgi:hypothetical protein